MVAWHRSNHRATISRGIVGTERVWVGANMVAIPAGYDDLLERPLYGHLATTRPDGSVQVSPMWFDWDGELLRFAHTTKRQKYHNVQTHPQVAMSISDPDNPYRYLEVRGEVARIEPDRAGELLPAYRQPLQRRRTSPPTPRPGTRLPPTPRTGWSSWCARPDSASINTPRSSNDNTKHRPWPVRRIYDGPTQQLHRPRNGGRKPRAGPGNRAARLRHAMVFW